ncbi:MAG TPA: hypothetical protein VGR73_11145 [Bryobacteraceae bacterium]|nr:hypothetical protein [Bryobacteraceae bacterium]
MKRAWLRDPALRLFNDTLLNGTLRRAILCGLAAAALLGGQARDGYERAYSDWRQSDPNLERDAGTAGDALTPRTEKAAAGAASYVSARKAFYDTQRAALAESMKVLEPFELPAETEAAKAAGSFLSAQEASVSASIQVFASNADRGIQQLSQALEKERAALVALRSAIAARETAADAARRTNESAGRARNAATDRIKAIAASFEQSSQDATQLAQAWTSYYRALATGARGLGGAEPTPAPAIRPSLSAPSTTSSAPPSAAGAPGRPLPAIPISRYTGSWSFLAGVSTYHGLPPVTFDVFVREEGGQIFGTVNARFIVGGKADPAVRFDFSGPLKAVRYQAFPLQTADGAKGTVELIPGNAFNLLEVNYTLDGAPAKVRESDVILVKR